MITKRQIAEAAVTIRQRIEVTTATTSTHRVARVDGLEDATVVESLGVYLVGAGFTRSVSMDLRIVDAFLDLQPDDVTALRRAVGDRIGATNVVTDTFRQSERDPWIAEGIAHLIIWLSRRRRDLAPRGRVRALRPLHVLPSETGVDLAAIFRDADQLGLTIGEAKASERNPTGHARDAAAFFAEVDGDAVRQVQVRDVVQILRSALRPDDQQRVTRALWEETRCYVPVVAYAASCSFAPDRARPTYRDLRPGPTGVLLICLGLNAYRNFFDDVSDAMRSVL